MLAFAIVCPSAAAGELPWPPEVAKKVDELIGIQRKARQEKDAHMFSHAAERKSFDSLLMELGSNTGLQTMAPALKQREGRELRAKVALIALDFSRNRTRYEEIEVHYFKLPLSLEERVAHMRRKYPELPERELRIFPQVMTPSEPTAEHTAESFRLAFEYHLLAPPSTSLFGDAWGLAVFALDSIHNPCCVSTFIELAGSSPDAIRTGGLALNEAALIGLTLFPCVESLDAMAALTEAQPATESSTSKRKLVLGRIGGTWGFASPDPGTYPKNAQRYKLWQTVVSTLPTGTPENPPLRSLGQAISALPPPPAPLPRIIDPQNPFSK